MTPRTQGFLAGVAMGALVCGGFALSTSGTSAAAPFESAQARPGVKYSSKVVLENDRVRVKDVTFPPGVLDTGMHTHELAHVGVILTKGSLIFAEPGGNAETVAFEAGSVGFRDANVTHQVSTPGPGPMRVIEVELK
jgi:quercetin dioxygenase-like cupin family protein